MDMAGAGGEGLDLSEIPSDKSSLKKQLEHMVSIVGPELFIKSSNAENQAIMKANASSSTSGGAGEGEGGLGNTNTSENGNPNPGHGLQVQLNSGQEEKEAGDSFDLVLQFLTALMTKTYAEAYSLGEAVLAREPGNTAVKGLMGLLEKVIEMGADDDGLTDSDPDSSEGSDTLNSDDTTDTSDELSDEESGSGSGSGSSGASSDNESPLGTDPESDLDPFAVIGNEATGESGGSESAGNANMESQADSLADEFEKSSL